MTNKELCFPAVAAFRQFALWLRKRIPILKGY